MRRHARTLVRSSFFLVIGLSASAFLIGACGDDDPVAPAEDIPDAQPDNSVRLPPPSNRDSGITTPPFDAGARDSGSDARSDAAPGDSGADTGAPPVDSGADTGTPPVDSGADTGTPPVDAGGGGGSGPLGSGELAIVYAGLDVGVVARRVASSTFAGSELNAWSALAPATESFNKGTASILGEGVDNGAVAWGRWHNGVATYNAAAVTYANNGGVAYAIGQRPTAIPLSGSFTTTTAGSINGFLSDGSGPPGSTSGTATILFTGGGGVRVGFSLQLFAGSAIYNFQSSGGTGNPTLSELQMDAEGFVFADYPIAAATTYCGGSCTARVRGFVGGPTCNYAALAVQVFKNAAGEAGSSSGVIVFER